MSFKRLDPQDFLISADSVVGGMFSGDVTTLTTFFTSSTQAGTEYYRDVSDLLVTNESSEVQFAVAYGSKFGSGSAQFDSNIKGFSPSSAVYGQAQNIIIGDENNNFTFGGVTPPEQSIYVLPFERARFKGNIFPGTLALKLTKGANSITLTDNSKDVAVDTFNEAGRVYELVSGSNGSAATTTSTNQVANGMTISGSYGLVLPDVGIIILNGEALDLAAGAGGIILGTGTSNNANDDNNKKLIDVIIAGASFKAQSQENVTSDFVFVRARNGEFNYSENPSFISGSTGEVIHNEFINAPQTFISSIGLYNDNNELLAVAKLSKPLKKDFTKEALIRVKLDF